MVLIEDQTHRKWLWRDAARQLDFFRPSLRADGGFDVLNWDGTPMPRGPQELHTTTRLIHSFALGHAVGHSGCDEMIDAGMAFLWSHHRDTTHGGYVWAVGGDDAKLAYGHAFVLLAAASAKQVGHPDADRLIDDVSQVIDDHFWNESRGLLREEFNADWSSFSTYRGMNANMHGAEAMLAAYEATGNQTYLSRAGRILSFFVDDMAAHTGWRIPEHYTENWDVDPMYRGNPMFRPAGTTPGHSFEMARLLLQHWDLAGCPETGAPHKARALIETALADAWLPEGGLCYTLNDDGNIGVRDRYWWPVAEGIGALSALMAVDARDGDGIWDRRFWKFAQDHFVDDTLGGWFPEIDQSGKATAQQFLGKPDIYHSLQATVLPLAGGVSRIFDKLGDAVSA